MLILGIIFFEIFVFFFLVFCPIPSEKNGGDISAAAIRYVYFSM